jgi:hypothetical protein
MMSFVRRTLSVFAIFSVYFAAGTADAAPPKISSQAVRSITQTTARPVWRTDIASDSIIYLYKNGVYVRNFYSSRKVTVHNILTVKGLTADTAYTYRVRSRANGESSTGRRRAFRTLPGTPPPPPGGEFTGDQASLSPYREALTPAEVRSFLGKVAFGGTPELEQLGIRSGLTPLVNAVLDYAVPADVTTIGNSIRSYSGPGGAGDISNERAFLTYHFLRGNPLLGTITLMAHDHFATNYATAVEGVYAGPCYPEHTDLLRSNALGSWELIMRGMGQDCIMGHWLNNDTNTKTNIGVNYSRETLELFILGTVDPHTRAANYVKSDVYELARAFTGYYRSSDGERWSTKFNSNRWDPGVKTLFQGKVYQASAAFKHDDAVAHIMYNHPGSARYLAGKYFAVLAHPYPTPQMLDTLGNDLRNNGFSVKPVLRKILMSHAMFSPRALNVCVSSPIEFMTSFIRRSGIPVSANERSMLEFAELSSNAGQNLLHPASVFGWRGCGVNRDGEINWGQFWRQPGGFLARINGVVDTISRAQQESNFFGGSTLVSDASLTSAAVVAAVGSQFNLSLRAEESALLTGYLEQVSGGRRAWSSLTAAQKRLKVSGLYELLATHPRRFLR